MIAIEERLSGLEYRFRHLEESVRRTEVIARAILEVTNPVVSFGEVQRILGYKSRGATAKWLKEHNIERVDRGYRRVLVISAATEPKD